MWIVELALRRPYTIAVSVILILLLGLLSLQKMIVDIFPAINIPVVGVVWNYAGLSPTDMERRIVFLAERAYMSTVEGISKLESTSIQGLGLQRVYFKSGTDIGEAVAEISAISTTAMRAMPPGIMPPVILKFDASDVPVAQMTIFSDTLKEEELFDYSLNFIRLQLYTIYGIAIPAPYGGKQRQINVDVDPFKLQAKAVSPQDILSALQASNIILPAGNARIGNYEYNILLNSSPTKVDEFKNIPIRISNGAALTIGDVANVSDAFADQTNIVRVNGKRSTYLNILKKAGASTVDVVNAVKKKIPDLKALAPAGFNMRIDFDQSVFVHAAISNVLREGFISAILVSLMIFVFLGSWRSVIIVCTSIPTAIFTSIIVLYLTDNSINIMTLGGLSLAIGMLVDDATVAVENIHRIRATGKPLTVSILEGSSQIALPALMATLVICIVFFPVVLLNGPARFLFFPLAFAVVSSMLASYVLSRTLVPLLSRMLLPGEKHGHQSTFQFIDKFNHGFELFREKYTYLLDACLKNRSFILWVCAAFLLVSSLIPFIVGRDFFPNTDSGLMKLHYRAAAGTRIEETEKQLADIENLIRKIIPAKELMTLNSEIGLPTSYNLAFVPSDNVGDLDAELSIALNPDHAPTVDYMKKIRKEIALLYPAAFAYFQPADIISQVLNFGSSAPIDIQFQYPDVDKSHEFAKILMEKLRYIPGVEDIALKQIFDYPGLMVNVDRIKAAQVGISQSDVANSMIISLSSSIQVSPSYFLNPENNINYSVVVKTPLTSLTNVRDILQTPITGSGSLLKSTLTSAVTNEPTQLLPTSGTEPLGNLATVSTIQTMGASAHTNAQRVVDIIASAEGRDLGSVTSDIEKKIEELGKLPPGMKIQIDGQGQVMNHAFGRLGLGLILAIVLVYLLMVILFQSWLDPFIVMIAVPGALCGILWMLLLTGTTINVESFMGSIMAVGIASSNSILLVSYANDVRVEKGLSALEAALEAGKTRIRPVLMTAIAMMIGMLPAALAMGDGGEQTAPLGRAVIGGLLVATFVTLIVVPIVYSLLRTSMPTKHTLDEKLKMEKEGKA